MRISLCMILKNEGKTISKAIQSVIDVVDEIVIGIDNKTTDDTYNRIFDVANNVDFLEYFDFEDNFSYIRNQYIKKCTGDYILVLDGHEYITPQSIIYLKKFKERNDTSLDVIDFNVLMGENGNTIFQQPRMFKSHIRYEYAIHNTITHLDNRVAMPQVLIIHDQPLERYQQRKKQRSKMNIDGLLLKQDDARSLFYLATQYYELEKWEDAKKYYQKYLSISDFESERYQAKMYLGSCFGKLEQKKEQKNIYLSCFSENVGRNEHIIALGNLYYDEERFDSASYFYRLATTVKKPNRFLILELNHYSWLPWYKLMLSSLMAENVDATMECVRMGKQLAPWKKEWSEVEEKVKALVGNKVDSKKGSIYIVDSLQTFIKPLLDELQKEYFVRVDQVFNPDNAIHADLIWCDWADNNAIAISNFTGKQKKILRIHSYEVYSDHINHIDFDVFDHIIFVARHVFDYLNNRLNIIDPAKTFIDSNKYLIINNGVDLDKFKIAENKTPNNKVAWAGLLREVKGIQLLLEIAKQNPHKEFHIAGIWQQRDLENYAKLNSGKNVIWRSWQNDLNEFYSDKTYAISTSIREGCPVALLEAIACGLQPIGMQWPGSKELLGEIMVDGWDRNSFEVLRSFAEKYFDLDNQIQQILDLIQETIGAQDEVIV